MEKQHVKLNTTGVKFTPSSFITYYEVVTNPDVQSEHELLSLDEVKAVVRSHSPIVTKETGLWNLQVIVPLKDNYLYS